MILCYRDIAKVEEGSTKIKKHALSWDRLYFLSLFICRFESRPGRAQEVFQKLPGGRALLLDPSGARGEPRGPVHDNVYRFWTCSLLGMPPSWHSCPPLCLVLLLWTPGLLPGAATPIHKNPVTTEGG